MAALGSLKSGISATGSPLAIADSGMIVPWPTFLARCGVARAPSRPPTAPTE
jgi:hypothetical protein